MRIHAVCRLNVSKIFFFCTLSYNINSLIFSLCVRNACISSCEVDVTEILHSWQEALEQMAEDAHWAVAAEWPVFIKLMNVWSPSLDLR